MKYIFPENFKFGVCDADLQVIGEKFTTEEEGAQQSIWDHFTKKSSTYGDPQIGIDRYHRWEEDIEHMKKLGVKYFRTSIAMNRMLKEDGSVNMKAVQWYQTYFKALNDAGIKIYPTIYHWDMPQAMMAHGGWTNRETTKALVQHAQYIVEYLDEYIEEYFILNEPWCASMLAYYWGGHAPGHKSLKEGILASHHLLLGMGMVFEAIKKMKPDAKVSTVFNAEPSYPLTMSAEDRLAAQYADGFFNRWFMDPLFTGKYPEDMVELYGENMPEIDPKDMEIIKIGAKLETFGLNFYCGKTVAYDETADLKYKYVMPDNTLTNELGWPITIPPVYPEGFYDIMTQVYFSYKNLGLKKMYIAENGTSVYSPWDGKSEVIEDQRRIYYLDQHIKQIHKAIKYGVPVEGYFLWTLMDNFEWAEGYRPESSFGIIHVDRKTLKRVWRRSAFWYQKLLKTLSLD